MIRWTMLMPVLAACATSGSKPGQPAPEKAPSAATVRSTDRQQYPSTYHRRLFPPVLIQHVNLLSGAGPELHNTSILIQDGKIVSIGATVTAPADALLIDGTGKWVTPGIIDTHSHLGVYAAPGTAAESDGNEATNPNTADVWAEHSVWPQDPQIPLAIAGGVTVMQVLPGSANLIGGRSATLRLVPARTVQEMKFPGAPYGMKMGTVIIGKFQSRSVPSEAAILLKHSI